MELIYKIITLWFVVIGFMVLTRWFVYAVFSGYFLAKDRQGFWSAWKD